jgi:hypothetical protein
MKIIRPVTVTDTVLDSSNLTENDYAVWSGATTYALGARVILTSTHRIYESAIASNLNNNPALNDPTKWINVGATNKWKAFDGVIADQATNTTSITYSLIPSSLVNAIAFFNLNATTVNVTVDDPTDGIVYDVDFPLVDNGAVESWFGYFFEPIVRKSEFIALDLPNYASATIDITITGETGEEVGVGEIVFGSQKILGLTLYNTVVGIQDYSRKDIDEFGNAVITKRRFAQTVDYDVKVNTESVRDVQKTLAEYRATPLVFTGTDEGSYGDLVYGYYRSFSINIATPSLSDATIEVEGLV